MRNCNFLFLALIFSSFGCGTRQGREPILIGHIAPFSGPNREIGEASRLAIQVVLPGLLESPNNTHDRQVMVIHVDSQGDPETVRTETTRLIKVNKVSGLIGTLNADLAEKMVHEAINSGIPAIVTGEIAHPEGPEGILQMVVPASQRGYLLARWIEEQKTERLGILIDPRYPIGTALTNAVNRQLQRTRIQIRELPINPKENEDGRINDLINWSPQLILLAVRPDDIRKTSATIPDKIPLIYGGEDAGPLQNILDKDHPLILATVACQQGLTQQGLDFFKACLKKSAQEKQVFPILQTADALRLFLDQLPSPRPNPILPRTERLTIPDPFQGYTGKITFRKRKTQRPVYLLQQNGKKTTLITPIDADWEAN